MLYWLTDFAVSNLLMTKQVIELLNLHSLVSGTLQAFARSPKVPVNLLQIMIMLVAVANHITVAWEIVQIQPI